MKKGVSKKLMKNYISMYILTLVLTIFTTIILLAIGGNFSNYDNINLADKLMEDDYNKINTEEIRKFHGTAFVVNEDLKVIPKCGEDLPSKDSFTMGEWTDFINKINISDRKFESYIKYNDKNRFWLVIKMPVAVNCQFDFNINTTKEVLPEAIFIVTILCLICFLVIFLYIYVYSKLTSKYFINPLKLFSSMVKKLEEGNYEERLEVNKDDEFGMLAGSFNKLADSLENEKKLRKKAEDNRKRLILDISHDLNNPLTITMGSIELCLEQDELSSKQKRYLKMAYDNSIRAKGLINDLFEYSKLDSPDYILKFEKVDICEYMRMQVASELDAIEEAGFSSEYEIPEKSIYVEMDKNHFGRVIHNLISNTIKYNKSGTKIKIAVKEREKEIEVIIEDNGIGMDKECALGIFDAFVRGNEKSQTNGTGLGLTIVKKIVTMHNGTISLETDINKGCTFSIILPKLHNDITH